MKLDKFYELGGTVEYEVLAYHTYTLSVNKEDRYMNDKKYDVYEADGVSYWRVLFNGDVLGEPEYYDDTDAIEFVESMNETTLLNGGYTIYE